MQKNEQKEAQNELEQIKNNIFSEYSKEELQSSIVEYASLEKDADRCEKINKLLSNLERSANLSEENLQQNREYLEQCRQNLEKDKELLQKINLQKSCFINFRCFSRSFSICVCNSSVRRFSSSRSSSSVIRSRSLSLILSSTCCARAALYSSTLFFSCSRFSSAARILRVESHL
jgi:hypothetical protein